MASTTAPIDYGAELRSVREGCEKLVRDTQAELSAIQRESEQVRHQLSHVLEQDNKLNLKLECAIRNLQVVGSTATVGEERESLSSQAVSLLQKHVESLKKENEELREMHKTSKKTIQNLEAEIQMYRQQIDTPERRASDTYKEVLISLDRKLKAQKSEFAAEKLELQDKIRHLQQAVKEKDSEIVKMKKEEAHVEDLNRRLEESRRHCDRLLHSQKEYRSKLGELARREKEACQKVDEALLIVDAAIKEKRQAELQEQVLREEVSTMAATIGQVMEDASQKVDSEVQALKAKYEEREAKLKEKVEMLTASAKEHQDRLAQSTARCKQFEEAYRTMAEENKWLVKSLHESVQSMEALESKLQTAQNVLVEYKRVKRYDEQHDKQIYLKYINENKELKEKYKGLIDENTRLFQEKIKKLQQQNAALQTDLQVALMQRRSAGDHSQM